MLTFTVPGRAVPKERPRVGPTGGWTPARTRAWEQTIAWRARAAHKGGPLEGLLEVGIVVRLRGAGGGDVDNYAKAVLDALQPIVYRNDRQVRRLVAELLDGSPDDGVEITVLPWSRP